MQEIKSVDFESEILRQYEFAEDFSDATIGLAYPQEIIYWSQGAQTHFGYMPRAAIGQDLSLVFPDFGLLHDLIEFEYAQNLDNFVEGKPLNTKGRRVGHGALIEVRALSGLTMNAKCSIYPLLVDSKLYLLLFLAIESAHTKTENAIAATDPKSPFSTDQSNPIVFGAQWALFLWKTQPALLVLLIAVGLMGLGIWRVESLGKAYKDIKGGHEEKAKPSPKPTDGTIVEVDPKTGDRTIRFGR